MSEQEELWNKISKLDIDEIYKEWCSWKAVKDQFFIIDSIAGNVITEDKPDSRAGTDSKSDRSQGNQDDVLCLPPIS